MLDGLKHRADFFFFFLQCKVQLDMFFLGTLSFRWSGQAITGVVTRKLHVSKFPTNNHSNLLTGLRSISLVGPIIDVSTVLENRTLEFYCPCCVLEETETKGCYDLSEV